ncbi:hypothetical protein [Haloarcula amylovorans]|uniref:hypothetical protein n=1 Tax=Haloarcula amylovorans TaxID=2562280 RepID=UPI00107633CA|nr:hypothetical protein [Halomicroarcula amylolytica]
MDEDRLHALHEHLEATGERPVERTASRWLGEAEAIALDAAITDLEPAVRRERVAKVAELLEEFDSTGDEKADEHVDAARSLAADLLAESDADS